MLEMLWLAGHKRPRSLGQVAACPAGPVLAGASNCPAETKRTLQGTRTPRAGWFGSMLIGGGQGRDWAKFQRAGHLEGKRWTRSSAVSGPSFATDWSSRGWPGCLAHRPRSAYRAFEGEGPWAFGKRTIEASCRSSAI